MKISTNKQLIELSHENSEKILEVCLFDGVQLFNSHILPLTPSFLHLRDLDLSHNYLGNEWVAALASQVLSSLKNLKFLRLQFNSIESQGAQALMDAIVCSSLQSLDLESNRLGSEGAHHVFRALPGLPCLTNLLLGYNQIRSDSLQVLFEVAPSISSLRELSLKDNELEIVTEEVSLMDTLTTLDLSSNKLVALPHALGLMPHLIKLNVVGNPLLSPPCTAVSGDNPKLALNDYFKAIERSGCCQYNRFKLVLLGEPCAGKTSLLRSLKADEIKMTAPNERTRFVDLTTLVLYDKSRSPIFFDAIDFDGKDVSREAQHLFLADTQSTGAYSNRSLYLLAHPADEELDLGKTAGWLRFLLSRNLLQDPFPLIFVVTKAEGYPKNILDRKIALFSHDLQFLMNNFGLGCHSSIQVVPFSCRDRNLRRSFASSLVERVKVFPGFNSFIPSSWCSLVEHVDKLKVYRSLETCNDNLTFSCSLDALNDKIPNKFSSLEEMRAGLAFCQSLGLVFNFQSSERLRNVVFLHPQWVAEVLKVIIRLDLHKLKDLDFSKMPYPAGSVQLVLDLDCLYTHGLLHHRLLPSLLWLRIQELNNELCL